MKRQLPATIHRAALAAGLLVLLGGCAVRPAGPPPVMLSTEPWAFEGRPAQRIRSPHYLVYTTLADEQHAQRIAQFMELALAQYRTLAPGIVPGTGRPMPIYLFATRQQWARFTAQSTGDDAQVYLQIVRGGYTVRDVSVLYDMGERPTYSVLAHEGWHQFVGRHFRGRLPPFLEEGLACTFEDVRWEDETPSWDLARNHNRIYRLRRSIDEKALYPLDQLVMLHAGEVINESPQKIEAFYAQSWGFALFLFILFGLPVASLLFWWWAHRRLGALRRRRTWRTLLAIFCGGQTLLFAALLATRWLALHHSLPSPLIALIYIWHLFILPATAAALVAGYWIALIAQGIGWIKNRPRGAGFQPASRPAETEAAAGTLETRPTTPTRPTRRQFLAAAVAAVPPLATVGATTYGLWQVHGFRVTPLSLAIPELPPALDGLRIAHLTDTHVGRFTSGRDLDRIVECVNGLNADLVLFTGDLIDYTLADLPNAVAMASQWRARHGVFLCEGNHDLFEDRDEFEGGVRDAGLHLLTNDAQVLRINGQAVQIMGTKWGGSGVTRRLPMLSQHTAYTLEQRIPGAFPILLAHHPHAFDQAAKAGIPLTLSGHTHGGQLMLSKNIGPGPLMFKYWSGLYRQVASSLVVSNGVGNWFPLRINAPAEIVDITLTRA